MLTSGGLTKSEVVDDAKIAAQESLDNDKLSVNARKLAQLQKTEPPKDQEQLVAYLMERLQVAEDSIRTAQEVIENERAIRKDSS